MKLDTLPETTITEYNVLFDGIPILEADSAPKLSFDYSKFRVDPTPEILVLGYYVHPNTKNTLLGGINLHYLTKKQLRDLRSIIPELMDEDNLYNRYWVGRRRLPEIFNNFYRTYNVSYIRNAEKDKLPAKFGLLKTAWKWLKNVIKKKEEDEAAKDTADLLKQLTTGKVDLAKVSDVDKEVEKRDDEVSSDFHKELDKVMRREVEKKKLRDDFRDSEEEVESELEGGDDIELETELPEDDIDPRLADDITDVEEISGADDVESDSEDVEESILIRYYSPYKKQYIVESYHVG